MRKEIIFIILTLLAFNGMASNAKKLKLTVGLGINNIFQRGDESQYVIATNEFPVTPAHSSLSYSFSVAYHFSHRFSLEAHSDFTPAVGVNKQNPVDMNTVYTKTFRQSTFSLNTEYQLFMAGKINFHLIGGAGVNKLVTFDASYCSIPEGATSMLLGTENHLFPAVNIGGGIIYNIDRRAGLKLDARYVKVFADMSHIDSIIVSFRFFVFLYWDGEYL